MFFLKVFFHDTSQGDTVMTSTNPGRRPVYRQFSAITLILLVTIAAMKAHTLQFFSVTLPVSPLIIAIIIGFAIKNTVPLGSDSPVYIKEFSRKILRLAIVFLGFKLSLSEIMKVGPVAIATISAASGLTIAFTLWLGKKMNVPLKRTLLLGSGISICGASAVAAVDSVIRSDEEDVAFAIGSVTLLGCVYMFLYPLLYNTLHIPGNVYAIWSGSSIHEVAQVAAAGSIMNNAVFEALASSVKMIRVLLIVPVTVLLMFFPDSTDETAPCGKEIKERKITVPWFAVFFFLVVIINSFPVLPPALTTALITADNWMMTAAMAGLGLDLSLRSMMGIGRKALILGIGASLFISAASAGIIALLL